MTTNGYPWFKITNTPVKGDSGNTYEITAPIEGERAEIRHTAPDGAVTERTAQIGNSEVWLILITQAETVYGEGPDGEWAEMATHNFEIEGDRARYDPEL